MQKFGSYVLDIQGSSKREGERPKMPVSRYQTWHNTLTSF